MALLIVIPTSKCSSTNPPVMETGKYECVFAIQDTLVVVLLCVIL